MEYIIGVDIGGTFTDCVVMDQEGAVALGKAPSTPEDFSVGAIDAVRDAAQNLGFNNEDDLIRLSKIFFHACTVGDNTLITRSGAKTGLITTKGAGDTLLIMRGKVTEGLTEAESSHLSALTKPQSLVPRSLIEEITERVDYKGSILVRLDQREAEQIVIRLAGKGVESVAICLLWSISNDSHEKILAEIFKKAQPSLFVTLSSEVAPYLGEYERTATTVFNAYIAPKISAYLKNLEKTLRAKGFRGTPMIMQAYGGVLGIEAACKNAIGTIESGPASGVVGSQFMGTLIGQENILATDMGGTTFKVSVIRDGNIERDFKPVILRYNLFSTKIWVESIGAGGGSIAWIDRESGLLKVGPQGAGAKPGPVCYSLGGTEPTVSDADLILGYLNDRYFLGGRMILDKDRGLKAMEEKIAKPLGMNTLEAASSVYRIANSHMTDLIRKATVERGYDPRVFTLFAFGGAGPVHAGRYAAELGIKEVVVPLTASVHGASGLISADVVYQYGKSDRLVVPANAERVNANFSVLVKKAIEDLNPAGFKEQEIKIGRSMDMRYCYQLHELNVPLAEGISEITEADLERHYERFDRLYEESFGKGSGYREAGMEILTFRVTATGTLRKPRIRRHSLDRGGPLLPKARREVYFQEYGAFVPTDIYDFERMRPGMEVAGPAIIETPVTTIVVNPEDSARVDEFRNVRIMLRP